MYLFLTYITLVISLLQTANLQELPDKGVPYMENFAPSEYDHSGKVWDIDTAPNNIVYMASNGGLLEYDGREWNIYEGSIGITRSIEVINDSLIYTGSDLDFGVWKRNKYKEFEYTSLYPFKEDLNQISEEFWGVHSVGDHILFISSNNIYVHGGENLTKIPAPNEIQRSFELNGVLYFVDEENGLYKLQDLSPELLSEFNTETTPDIVGIYESEDDLILVSQNSGLYIYTKNQISQVNTDLSLILGKANVFSFEQIGDSSLVFGTISQGLFVSDLNGNIIHHVNKNKGLQNNTVLSLHYDQRGVLWLSMDYGISYLDLKNEFTFFYDFNGEFGSGYSAVLKDEQFYLGTNQGLYTARWSELDDSRSDFESFELIPGSEGQVWSLNVIDGQVWIGHDRGLFILEGGELKRVGEQRGVWTIRPYKDYLLAGTYNGISIYRKAGGDWVFWKKMSEIFGSCNQILVEEGNTIWVNIPTYGVIKATLGEDMEPEERGIFMTGEFTGNDPMLVAGDEGIQVVTGSHKHFYDPKSRSFDAPVEHNVSIGLEDMMRDNARPKALTSGYDFYPLYNGFALRNRNLNEDAPDQNFQLVFREIEAFSRYESKKVYSGTDIPYRLNNIRLEALVPNTSNITYQYKLDDADSWVDLNGNSRIDLVSLPHGDHTVVVRAIEKGIVVAEDRLGFSVMAPWFLSWYAYLFYLLVIIVLIWFAYYWQDLSLKKQKKYLLTDKRTSLQEQEEKYRQRLKTAEKARLKAQIEQVKEQLKTKTIELATKAKENDAKNRILTSLKKKLESIEENPDSLKRKLNEMKKVIDTHSSSDDNTFEIQIDQLHQKFYESLREEFSDLTRYDLRLCAYIKIGFDSKEIADLLNIKPSSVYISRSRLRKKLNIETDEDLHSYLNSIQ